MKALRIAIVLVLIALTVSAQHTAQRRGSRRLPPPPPSTVDVPEGPDGRPLPPEAAEKSKPAAAPAAAAPKPGPQTQTPTGETAAPAAVPAAAPDRATGPVDANALAAQQERIPTTLPKRGATTGALNLQNASLTEVIDVLARQLKLNYILDPRVKGGVTINTYGETRSLDTRNLLDLILRINGAAMVQSGDIWRIVPLTDVLRMPIEPQVDARDFEANDAPMLNLLFLKYAAVEEVAKLLDPFLGEGARSIAYPPANLLLMQDSQRNMRRLLDLISLFDSEQFTGQRVRLFELKDARPSDVAKELDGIFRNISLNDKASPVKFLPVDRINTLITVAANPGVFDSVKEWIGKLDVPVQITVGAVDNYVYRVRYGRAEMLAGAIMMLYGGYGYGGYGGGMYGGGMFGGGYGGGGYGGGMYGGGMYGGGYGGGMYGGMFGGGYGGGGYGGGMYGGGMPAYGGMGGAFGMGGAVPQFTPPYQPNAGLAGGPAGAAVQPGANAAAGAGIGQTAQYLTPSGQPVQMQSIPRIVPNPLDNTLLIQGTPQEYAGILKLLRDLDVPPRQILVEARIYELSLGNSFASGIEAYLQPAPCVGSGCANIGGRAVKGFAAGGATRLTAGMMIGRSRELLGILTLAEAKNEAKVISRPIVIATDSIPATITVGAEIPTLTGQAVTGVQSGGNSLFAQNIQNRNTGITVNILARATPGGVVTMVLNQEVSAPQGTTGPIASPSFSKRSVQTQITVQDGDTVAIGGIIDERSTMDTAGIPVLHRLPVVGAAFGRRSYTKARSELVIFLTPRVIYDVADMVDATEELRSRLKRVNRLDRD